MRRGENRKDRRGGEKQKEDSDGERNKREGYARWKARERKRRRETKSHKVHVFTPAPSKVWYFVSPTKTGSPGITTCCNCYHSNIINAGMKYKQSS